jgi:predicted  nucleic acid-binding Zn-ribbon protein
MKSCPNCGKQHFASHPHFKLKDKLTDKGFPTHAKKYATAHEAADKAEKNKFGAQSYKMLQKTDNKIPKGELAGKNSKKGNIEVSRRVPKGQRTEVAYHESVENRILRKKK